ncbi:MAG: hypothetical protein AVDCRST_MAG57-2487, partial [uncultured Blastococcus sp.]
DLHRAARAPFEVRMGATAAGTRRVRRRRRGRLRDRPVPVPAALHLGGAGRGHVEGDRDRPVDERRVRRAPVLVFLPPGPPRPSTPVRPLLRGQRPDSGAGHADDRRRPLSTGPGWCAGAAADEPAVHRGRHGAPVRPVPPMGLPRPGRL